jgi:hypothetical protein
VLLLLLLLLQPPPPPPPFLNILCFLSPSILERISTSSLLFVMFCIAYLF